MAGVNSWSAARHGADPTAGSRRSARRSPRSVCPGRPRPRVLMSKRARGSHSRRPRRSFPEEAVPDSMGWSSCRTRVPARTTGEPPAPSPRPSRGRRIGSTVIVGTPHRRAATRPCSRVVTTASRRPTTDSSSSGVAKQRQSSWSSRVSRTRRAQPIRGRRVERDTVSAPRHPARSRPGAFSLTRSVPGSLPFRLAPPSPRSHPPAPDWRVANGPNRRRVPVGRRSGKARSAGWCSVGPASRMVGDPACWLARDPLAGALVGASPWCYWRPEKVRSPERSLSRAAMRRHVAFRAVYGTSADRVKGGGWVKGGG